MKVLLHPQYHCIVISNTTATQELLKISNPTKIELELAIQSQIEVEGNVDLNESLEMGSRNNDSISEEEVIVRTVHNMDEVE